MMDLNLQEIASGREIFHMPNWPEKGMVAEMRGGAVVLSVWDAQKGVVERVFDIRRYDMAIRLRDVNDPFWRTLFKRFDSMGEELNKKSHIYTTRKMLFRDLFQRIAEAQRKT